MMKKVICLGLLLSGFLGFSQLREKGTIELTPTIGLATANYYSSEDLANSSISTVNIGVNGDYFLNNRWSLRSGLLIQTMGSEFNSALPGGGYEYVEEKLTYLTIPVNANWHFGSTRKWYLNLGPSFGFLMSAKANGDDIKDLANGFQLGLNYGIGYKIEISEKISISIDYQGMSGLSEVPKDAPIDIKNMYNSLNAGAVIKL